jgi:hypothetical protein
MAGEVEVLWFAVDKVELPTQDEKVYDELRNIVTHLTTATETAIGVLDTVRKVAILVGYKTGEGEEVRQLKVLGKYLEAAKRNRLSSKSNAVQRFLDKQREKTQSEETNVPSTEDMVVVPTGMASRMGRFQGYITIISGTAKYRLSIDFSVSLTTSCSSSTGVPLRETTIRVPRYEIKLNPLTPTSVDTPVKIHHVQLVIGPSTDKRTNKIRLSGYSPGQTPPTQAEPATFYGVKLIRTLVVGGKDVGSVSWGYHFRDSGGCVARGVNLYDFSSGIHFPAEEAPVMRVYASVICQILRAPAAKEKLFAEGIYPCPVAVRVGKKKDPCRHVSLRMSCDFTPQRDGTMHFPGELDYASSLGLGEVEYISKGTRSARVHFPAQYVSRMDTVSPVLSLPGVEDQTNPPQRGQQPTHDPPRTSGPSHDPPTPSVNLIDSEVPAREMTITDAETVSTVSTDTVNSLRMINSAQERTLKALKDRIGMLEEMIRLKDTNIGALQETIDSQDVTLGELRALRR